MKKFVLLGVLLLASAVQAQDMKVTKGNFDFLKNQNEINVLFDYSNFTMMADENPESVYISERTKDLNAKNKGVGDLWEKKWQAAKGNIWSQKFLELMTIIYSKARKDVKFDQELTKAKYTLIVKTTWIYPGWDAGIMKQKAKVSTVLQFVETANPSTVLLEIVSKEAPGDQFGNNFSNESRIGEGYAKTAKSLAKMMLKKTS